MAEFIVLLRKEIKSNLIRQGMQTSKGPPQKRIENFFEKTHTHTSLDSLSDSGKEHAHHFEQQPRSTSHSGHFDCARWRIPP